MLSFLSSHGRRTGKLNGRRSRDSIDRLLLRLRLSLGGAILGSSVAGLTGKAADYNPVLLGSVGAALGFAIALATVTGLEQKKSKGLR